MISATRIRPPDISCDIGDKLKELRTEHGLSVEEFLKRLNKKAVFLTCDQCGTRFIYHKGKRYGKCCSKKCAGKMKSAPLGYKKFIIYKWELGKSRGGSNMPPDFYPIISEIYGYKTATGWLPEGSLPE